MSVESAFDFWVPITKAKTKEDGSLRIVEGIASTPHLDLQNETVDQSGIDFKYFLNHGYFNWDHKPGSENKIGEPWECKVTPKGLYVKGIIYKGKKIADNVWEHIQTLSKNTDSKRRVGFSLQGKTVRRNGNSILKCWIQDVAITTAPINHNTYLDIVKSLGTSSWCSEPGSDICSCCMNKTLSATGSVLVPESLDSNAKVQLYGWGEHCEDDDNKKKRRGKRRTKKSLSDFISKSLGYSEQRSELLTDILWNLSDN